MIITILADNTAPFPYRAEHGFSAYIGETGSDTDILFDTGMGALFQNASCAGIDFERIGDVILSHGHYDHTDALYSFLEKNPTIRIHAASDILREHYSLRTGACRKISVSDENRRKISALPEGQFITVKDAASIHDGLINLVGRIPRSHGLETPSPLLFADNACTLPDTVPDEIALWARTPKGLLILTGCCHAGLINTCEHIRSISGEDSIHTVIGGFHLSGVKEERLIATAEYVKRTQIRRLIPCHCTGDAEIEWLHSILGSGTVEKGECGMSLRV